MLNPSDVVAAKILVQLGDISAEDARSHLRATLGDPERHLDVVARLANMGLLAQPAIKRIRQYVALFEHVRHEAIYLRQLENRRLVPHDAISELIARLELSSYRRRLGAVLVEQGKISIDQAVEIERETRRVLQREDHKVVERYTREDFEAVARPLIPRANVDLNAFRISVLFRSRETHAKVSKALLRLRLEESDEISRQAAIKVATQAAQVYVAREPPEIPKGIDEHDTVIDTGSARFRTKGEETNAELQAVEMIGDYVVVEILGQGGMGAVYLAREEGMGPMVAIKVKHSKLADPMDLARFDREAHICGLINHPNTVHLIERGMTEDALAYLVIPFYAGQNLRERLKEEGALEPALALHIMEQLLEGTEAIHQAGVVHRDLKPENVFLLAGKPPQVRIVDLGIARVLDDHLPTEERQFRTLPGVISGSPAYIAPESITSDPIGPGTDIYSLGVIFFQMLTGKLPLSAGTAYEFLREHLMGVPLSLAQAQRDINWIPELEELLAAMLAKEPNDRPKSCQEILDALRGGLGIRVLHALDNPTVEAPSDVAPDPQTDEGVFNRFFKMLGGR